MANYLREQGRLVFYDWDEALNSAIDIDVDWVIEHIVDHGYTVIRND